MAFWLALAMVVAVAFWIGVVLAIGVATVRDLRSMPRGRGR